MNKITHYIHRFNIITRQGDGSTTIRTEEKECPMFIGLCKGAGLAVSANADVEHSFFNEGYQKWFHLGVFHPDGTCTDWVGERRRFHPGGGPGDHWLPVD